MPMRHAAKIASSTLVCCWTENVPCSEMDEGDALDRAARACSYLVCTVRIARPHAQAPFSRVPMMRPQNSKKGESVAVFLPSRPNA